MTNPHTTIGIGVCVWAMQLVTSLPQARGGGCTVGNQAANLAGFRASEDPRFEAGIPDFMNGILNFSIHFNVVHRKVDWRNPKMKSLNSMPVRTVVPSHCA